jgi:hypothetical protein
MAFFIFLYYKIYSIIEYQIRNVAISQNIFQAVHTHHWLVLGRDTQMITTYSGLSMDTIPAKVA